MRRMLILVHRGWGLLTFLVLALCIPLGVYASNGFSDDVTGPRNFAVGLLLAGIVLVLLGTWLNQVRAKRLVEQFAVRHRAELDHLVRSGQFNLGHPWPVPTSMAMAQSQADQAYEADVAACTKAQVNRHTLYGIPMQVWGYIALVLAVGLAIASLFG